ncbi:MAG: TRAP transporter small permease [Pseudomonadota bacterium]
MTVLRRTLDTLYLGSGIIAACFMVAILAIIVGQMAARWFGITFPGAADYAGYCTAAASFFSFAYALKHDAHIRVSILLNAVGRHRRWLEVWCFAIGAATATLLARYAIKATVVSHRFGEISQGQDATPIWIPQLAMSIGTVILAIAFWDRLIRLILGHDVEFGSSLEEQGRGK